MANPYPDWVYDAANYSAGQPVPVTSFGNKVLNGINAIWYALTQLIDISEADGALLHDWQNPTYYRNTAGDAWMAKWLDNTDTSNIVERTKMGTSKVACTPSSITDGNIITEGDWS